MRNRSYSRKRNHDERCRSESESSCFSSSLKSPREPNGYCNYDGKRLSRNYKRTKYSGSSLDQSKKNCSSLSGSYKVRNNGSRFRKRKQDRKVTYDYSPAKKRSRYTNEKLERSVESIVEKDSNGYLIMKEGAILKQRYKVIKQLGEGTFGRVVQCRDLHSHMGPEEAAVKVIRDVSKYREAAYLELKVLDLIRKYDPRDKKLVISALDSFEYHGHIGIVFPLLGPSIFDFLKSNHYAGYPMWQVRHMAYQIAKAVKFLHNLKLTHTDLKPENILLVNGEYDIEYNENTKRNVKTLRDPSIRVIDLGSATFEDEHHTSVVATRHYRPLEVVLGLGWSYPCDVWSVGCILFELYTGVTMFMTHDNLEHLAMMERVFNRPLPRRMTAKCTRKVRCRYFRDEESDGKGCGSLRWDPESKAGRYVRSEVKPLRRYITRHPPNRRELELFDLIEEMLEYNPRKRITMAESLRHPFIYKYDENCIRRQRSHSNSSASDSISSSSFSSSFSKRRNYYSSEHKRQL